MVYKNKLHVSCWNINGFKHKGVSKYSDPNFINEINKNDIVCLLETHCSLDDSIILQDFNAVHLIRPKSNKSNKRSGGISVLVKSNIRKGVIF